MKFIQILSFIFLLVSSCAVLKNTPAENAVLFSINGKPTIADEFIYVYEKNNFNNDSLYQPADVDAYFDLFLKFKLKVEAAKTAGIDTTAAFINEYNTYKNQLIRPYLSEAKEQDKLAEEAYEHMQYEVDASHILISVDENAAHDDTLVAFSRISEILAKAKSGEDFGKLAEQYSEDPSAKSNQGRLGYFTAFQMVYAFEEAAYNTPVDSVSDILRSRFGYHILKVHDKRPYSGMVKVSHIMVTNQNGALDDQQMQNKIFEIHEQIQGGADWNELCRKYSDDQRTKNDGGTLPFIGLRQINDEAFENTAFGLETPGDISDPVRSRFGWHIIKLEEKQGLRSFDEMEEEIKQKISSDGRALISRKAVISRLKKEYNFEQNDANRRLFLNLADDSLLNGKWDVVCPDSIADKTVFSIASEPYSIAKIDKYVATEQKRRTGISAEMYLNDLIDKFIEEKLLEQEEKQLVVKNREFRMLLNEYYEGILLFEIMNNKVWGKAVQDTSGLRTFFDQHQENYQWKTRARTTVFRSANTGVIDSVRTQLNQAPFQLVQTELLPGKAIVDQGDLDLLIRYYRLYDNSFFSVHTPADNSKSDQNPAGQMTELMQYLHDFGIKEESIVIVPQSGITGNILVALNSNSKKSLEVRYNTESALTLQAVEGLFEQGDNQVVDSVNWQIGVYELEFGSDHHLVVIDEVLNPGPKILEETRGSVISDYQNYLEETWIQELKATFDVNINYTTLDQIKTVFKKKLHSSS